jgi:hypothetical protein
MYFVVYEVLLKKKKNDFNMLTDGVRNTLFYKYS